MKTNVFVPMLLALAVAAPALAQSDTRLAANAGEKQPAAVAETEDTADAAPAATSVLRPTGVQGLNTFEAPKFTGPFDGIKVTLGGAFALTFQALDHSNTAAPRLDATTGADLNKLADIRPGVNLPNANLNLGVQLAPGINMVLESYMSSRHHNEFWVKGGYATIDRSPLDIPALNKVMQYTTIRAGMFEPNYGDALFRRTDNGNTISNPFAENYILDAFTTEPGADVMVRFGDAFVLGGVTTGQNKGDITDGPVAVNPAFLGKAGYDRQFSDALRFRLSGSIYNNSSSPSTTLYWGDRTGGPYWGVVDNASGSNHWNGRLNPGFRNEVTAVQINPFVKLGGLELFGVVERASGKAVTETERRDISQYAGDLVYRFLGDKLYVGGRYNVVKGDLSTTIKDISVDRAALAAGWFISPTMLTKVEYVQQSFDGFGTSDIRNGAEFNGLVIQGALSF